MNPLQNISFKLTKIILLYILLGLIFPMGTSCKRNKSVSKKSAHVSTGHKKLVSRAIDASRAYTGVPYKFGGINKVGMDCSGLLFTAFKDIGIDIPRPSKEQCLFGQEIKLNDLQPGDWLFFSDKEGSSKIVHVGMVTEVRNEEDVRFINASNKLGVVEDQLFINYWQKVFVKAVRPKCFE
jgi:probable lipoprotein NlpC